MAALCNPEPKSLALCEIPSIKLSQNTTHLTCIEHSCKFLCDKMKRLTLSFSTFCLSVMVPTVIVMIQSPMQTIKNRAQGICSNCLALNYNSTQTHHPCNRRATTLCLQCQKNFNNLQTLLFLSKASQGRFKE